MRKFIRVQPQRLLARPRKSTAIDQLTRFEQPGLSDKAPPTEEALEALKKETLVAEWELSTQRQREQGWEWEALNPERGLRARVKVSESPHRMASVYQYPTAPEEAAHKTQTPSAPLDRLVVTPLGGALGIEANCFQVEIGPYEIVLAGLWHPNNRTLPTPGAGIP